MQIKDTEIGSDFQERVKGNTHYQGNLSRVIFMSLPASKISGGSKSSQSYNNRIGYTWKALHGF